METPETPIWAKAYKSHFDLAESERDMVPKNTYGMPMLPTPVQLDGLGFHVEAKPPSLPPPKVSALAIPPPPAAVVTSKKPDAAKTLRAQDSLGPVIIIQFHNQPHEDLKPDTLFPLSPLLTEQKSVIDYLAVPVPHWYTFDEDEWTLPDGGEDHLDNLVDFAGGLASVPTQF